MTRRGLRRGLGAYWVVAALAQAEPAKFTPGYPLGELAQSVMGEPGWLRRAIYAVLRPLAPHWPWVDLAAVLVELGIGLGMLLPRFARPALAASLPWALVVWVVGEGLGTLPSGFALSLAGAPGPALLLAVLALLAWPGRAGPAGPVARRGWAVCWMGLWGGAALLALPWVYPPRQVWQANLVENGAGSPAAVQAAGRWLDRLAGGHATALAAGLAAVELAVAAGAVRGSRRRGWLVVAMVLAVIGWVVAQDFGGLLAADGTDAGLGPLVVLLALAGWAPARSGQPAGSAPEPAPEPASAVPMTTVANRARVITWTAVQYRQIASRVNSSVYTR